MVSVDFASTAVVRVFDIYNVYTHTHTHMDTYIMCITQAPAFVDSYIWRDVSDNFYELCGDNKFKRDIYDQSLNHLHKPHPAAWSRR
jgi:hypothetical protein